MPLSRVLESAIIALEAQPFGARIAEARARLAKLAPTATPPRALPKTAEPGYKPRSP